MKISNLIMSCLGILFLYFIIPQLSMAQKSVNYSKDKAMVIEKVLESQNKSASTKKEIQFCLKNNEQFFYNKHATAKTIIKSCSKKGVVKDWG